MTDFVFPESVLPSSMTVNLVSNSIMYNSQFNNATTSHNFQGARWVATLNFDNIDNFTVKEIDILQAFVWQLEGVNGRFKMWDMSKSGHPEKGTPVVSTDSEYGSVLQTSGWQPNTQVIGAARYFEVNGELKFTIEDAYSDSSGNCTLRFVPPLRAIPPKNAPIKTNKPMGTFRLADNDQGAFNLTAGLEATLSLEVVEAFTYAK